MKKSLYLASFIFFISASFASAQNITTPDTSVRVTVRNQINSDKPVNQEIKQKIEVKREGGITDLKIVRTKISATRRERIRNYFGKAVTRTESLITRLENLISRMEVRIEKINEGVEDLDTTQAETNIADAKIALQSATDKLQEVQDSFEDVLSSDDPKDAFGGIVELFRGIKADLKEVHILLVHSIGELKGLRIGNTQ